MAEDKMGVGEKIVDLFGRFIYRDYFYFVAGCIISAHFIVAVYRCGWIIEYPKFSGEISSSISELLPWAIIGFLHALGFVNQEVWSQSNLLKTATSSKYRSCLKKIYKKHTGKDWPEILPMLEETDTFNKEFERVLNLKQICTSIGSSMLTSLCIELCALFVNIAQGHFDYSIFLLVLFDVLLSLIFAMCSWIHNMTQSAMEIYMKRPV